MKFRCYDSLPDESREIRQKVFVDEQGFQEEFDQVDDNCLHIVLFDEDKAVATGRAYYNDENGCYAIGRLAVLKEYRDRHLGASILAEIEKETKARYRADKIGLSAQQRVQTFYEKQGYKPHGDIYLDEGCPHVWMEKIL